MTWNLLLSRFNRPINRRARRAQRGHRPTAFLRLEHLEDRTVPAAFAHAAVGLPAVPVLGQNLTFTVTLDNTSPVSTGYGPYVELVLPHHGVPGLPVNGDVDFVSASFQGAPVTGTVDMLDMFGQATNPLAFGGDGKPVVVTGAPNDQLVFLPLPVDHLAPGQSATVTVQARLATPTLPGETLAITANGGFTRGNDAAANPTVDPSVVGPGATLVIQPQAATGPAMSVRKSVVSADPTAGFVPAGTVTFSAPGSAGPRFAGTIDSNTLAVVPVGGSATGLKPGDRVTFAVVVENVGSSQNAGAFDTLIRDTIPAGYMVPVSGLNLAVSNGAGQALAYKPVGGGLFDSLGGIRLTDPSAAAGAVGPFAATGGKNVVVVTYDLILASTPRDPLAAPISAAVVRFAATPGGPSDLTTPGPLGGPAPLIDPFAGTTTLAGSVYVDANNNGVRNVGESGVAGVVVNLSGTETVSGASVNLSTTSALDGSFQFTALAAGTYTLTEQQPSGYADGLDAAGGNTATPGVPSGTPNNAPGGDTVSGIQITDGATFAGYTFGEQLTGVAGLAFVDTNANGTYDPGEPGLGNVTLTLTDAANNLIGTAVTAADGSYGFAGLAAGGYNVIETQPTGYGSSSANAVPVTVPASGGAPNVNFGDTTGVLSGVVFNDANSNGTQDNGESGLAGVTVQVQGTNDAGAAVTVTTTTLADGTFTVGGLLSNTGGAATPYTLTVTAPAGFVGGTATAGSASGTPAPNAVSGIVLGPGVTATGYKFAEVAPNAAGTGTLSGEVFNDASRDGVLNNSETGVQGATVTLTQGNTTIGSVTTAGDGLFTFSNLAPGTYTLTETPPNGFGISFGNPGPFVTTVTVDAAGNVTPTPPLDIPNNTGSLEGYVYVDQNNNGVQDPGEPFLGGVTVTLTGVDANAVNVTRTDTTLSAPNGTFGVGHFGFGGLLSGTYTLTVTGAPAGFTTGDAFGPITLGPGVCNVNNLLRVTPVTTPQKTSLTGQVLVVPNACEPAGQQTQTAPLPGVTVTLKDAAGNTVATATTDNNGNYIFGNLTPANYTVTVTPPLGYGLQTGAPGSQTVVLTATGLTGINFQLTRSVITGVVYFDQNSNGGRDAGEPGIAGVTITLTGTDATGAPVSMTATTAADGSFAFVGLLNGTYTITETQPAGFQQGTNAVGTSGGTITGDVISSIQLAAPNCGLNYLFGETRTTTPQTTSVAGQVLVVPNPACPPADQAPPAPLPGVTVTLRDATGATVATTTTDANGNYSFANLAPGNYTVVETVPAGYAALPNTPTSQAVLVPAAGLTGVNFQVILAAIHGTVYYDQNANGVRDGSEPGIAGVTITLTGTDINGAAVSHTLTTDANGNFDFTGLLTGTYAVSETQPAGFQQGTNAVGTSGGTISGDVISGITLGAGVCAQNYLFGEICPRGTVAGFVYIDTNNNGVREPGEQGIRGVLVTLTGTLTGGGTVTRSTFTGPDGSYEFANLLPGTYQVLETQPAGFLDGLDAVGTQGGTTGNDVLSGLPVVAGTLGLENDFGELLPATIPPTGNPPPPGKGDFLASSGTGATPPPPSAAQPPVPTTPSFANTVSQGCPPFSSAVHYVATGADAGGSPHVTVYDYTTGRVVLSFMAYDPSFTGGVRVALGDVNGDGTPDVITAAGPGGGPHVKVFDGKTGALLASFMAYDAGFTGGVYVAAADLDGDGKAEVITGAGAGGGPHVKAFDPLTVGEVASFFAYDAGFTGGVRVAGGDLNGDGRAEIITGAGAGGGPHVKAFGSFTGATPTGTIQTSELVSFFAYDAGFTGGVYVAAGDINGDGKADIVTGAGETGAAHVKAFSGAGFALGGVILPGQPTGPGLLASFYGLDPTLIGGARVGVIDINGDGKADIVVGSGPTVANQVRIVDGQTLSTLDYFASDPSFLGGVFVTGG
jgi:protocatechuate 3,4-dioxygenase beta subunit